jgi:hypothetical protein
LCRPSAITPTKAVIPFSGRWCGTESVANEQPLPLNPTSVQNKSAARSMSFLKEIENYVNKRAIGVALAQSLFFIAKLNHI